MKVKAIKKGDEMYLETYNEYKGEGSFRDTFTEDTKESILTDAPLIEGRVYDMDMFEMVWQMKYSTMDPDWHDRSDEYYNAYKNTMPIIRQIAKLKDPFNEYIKPEYIGKTLYADGEWKDTEPVKGQREDEGFDYQSFFWCITRLCEGFPVHPDIKNAYIKGDLDQIEYIQAHIIDNCKLCIDFDFPALVIIEMAEAYANYDEKIVDTNAYRFHKEHLGDLKKKATH